MKINPALPALTALCLGFVAPPARATAASAEISAGAELSAETSDTNGPAVDTIAQENTPAACQDGTDNDNDSHTDCADQDCQIFAVCVKVSGDGAVTVTPNPGGADRSVVETSSASITVYHAGPKPERKRQCSDGIDNNGDGLIDCHEASCQRSYYCRRKMYEYPKEGADEPGLFVNFGFGVALPNYRVPRATTDSVYGEVPFEPDLGGMFDLQAGYLFFKWLGAGINFKSAASYASNEFAHTGGPDEDFKYWGYKTWLNVGGFVRLQWPFKRLVPYVNIHAGYSVARNRWNVYDDANSWDDIWDHESDSWWPIEGIRDERYSGPKRHFTFAFEPGLDVYVVERLFAVGVKAWLPVVASADSERDNVGVMLSFTFTPSWRGKAQLKEEYKNPPAPVVPAAASPSPEAAPAPPMSEPSEAPITEPETGI